MPGIVSPADDARRGFHIGLLGTSAKAGPQATVDTDHAQRDAQLDAFLSQVRSARCSAVVCDMDFTASLLATVIRQRGIAMPRQLALTGVGDTPWSQTMRPALTTVAYGHREIALLALAACLLPPPSQVEALTVEPHLIVRDST